MADEAQTSLFQLIVNEIKRTYPDASEQEILRRASARENIIKGAIRSDHEVELKAQREKEKKEALRAAELKKEQQREKEW